jgi:PAS domain-containing protein
MLFVLTTRTANEEDLARFERAFALARGNVTEAAERPAIEVIASHYEAALQQQVPAREKVVSALLALSEANRSAILRAAQESNRLGRAAGWALALLTLFGLALTAVVAERIRRGIVSPLNEIGAVLLAQRTGNWTRRCARKGNDEVLQMLSELNDLLDQQMKQRAPDGDSLNLRPLVTVLLEHARDPLLVVKPDGSFFAANQAAMKRLNAEDDAFVAGIRKSQPTPNVDVEWTDSAGLRLIKLAGVEEASPASNVPAT